MKRRTLLVEEAQEAREFLDSPFVEALERGPYLPFYDPNNLNSILFALCAFDTNLDEFMVAGSGYDGINYYFRGIESVYSKALGSVRNGFYDDYDFERDSESIDFHLEHIRSTRFPTIEIQNVYDHCGVFIDRVREELRRFATPAGQLKILDPECRYPFLAEIVRTEIARTVSIGPSRDPKHPGKLVLWSRTCRGQITVVDEMQAVAWVRERRMEK